MNNVVEYTKDDVGFYPTPPEVAEKMLSQINWKTHIYKSILEPSAGKGNLVDALLRKAYSQYGGRYGNTGMKIDCVEIDPYLRGIIEHEFCGAKLNEIYDRVRALENTRYDARDEKTNSELAQLQEEKGMLCEEFGYDPRMAYGDKSKFTPKQLRANDVAEKKLNDYLASLSESRFKKAIIVYIELPD